MDFEGDRVLCILPLDGPHVGPGSLEETTMATTAKKADAPTKPRKTTATKRSQPKRVKRTAISHEDVARLAHRYWAERGHQHGRAEEDWFRAEQELLGRAS